MDLINEIVGEMDRAERRFGPFTSTHEAYGVLAEEMLELLEAIRANAGESVRGEAIQVAAVAARLAGCCLGSTAFNQRSGFKGN